MSQKDRDSGGLPAALAATIHDTANALTLILGWLERAAQPELNREDALKRAMTHAHWARDQLRDLIGAQRLPQPPDRSIEALSIASLLRRVVEDLAVEGERADVTIQSDCTLDAAPKVVVAPLGAWRILTNLLLNALAASPRGGQVVVTAALGRDGFLEFAVEDKGPGVSIERRQQLFTSGGTTRVGGAGIGLRGSLALARAHGGNLLLAPSKEVGARFELEWPMLAAQERSSLAGVRILLLEDDDSIIELLELSLGGRGASVTSVRALDALEATLSGTPFDVLLADLSPFEATSPSGVDPTRHLARFFALGRTQVATFTVLVISGSVSAGPDKEFAWLRKPFTPSELVEALVGALGRPV